MSSLITDSINSQQRLVNEIGLKLLTSEDFPFLKIGVTIASFHSFGTTLASNRD
jgi:hypothetical protein